MSARFRVDLAGDDFQAVLAALMDARITAAGQRDNGRVTTYKRLYEELLANAELVKAGAA